MSDTRNRKQAEVDDDLHYVGTLDELTESERLLVQLEGLEIGVFKANDELYAILNYCTHQGGPLCEGMLAGTLGVDDDFELIYSKEDQVLSCPWHGWEFDIQTGDHLSHTDYSIPTYETVVVEDEVYVRL